MEHQDLINELPKIETMELNDRIELAKKRRQEQIENYSKWSFSAPVSVNQKQKRIKFTPETQLTEAVADGNLKELKELLDKGINPNCTTYEGLTPLHHSCIEGNLDIVNLLLMRGADVNARDSDGWTPLHAAATCGHKEIVELLVRTGADLLALNEDEDMAFQIADDEDTLYFLEREMLSQGITPKMADELRQAKYLKFKKNVQRVIHDGGDINAPVTANNGSFLHVAISHFYNDIVKLLLNNDASDTVEDCEGWRPIHVAAYWENMNAVEILVKYRNTDLTAVTKNGERPYDICEDSSCRIYILRILNKHIVNSKDSDERSASEKICKIESRSTNDNLNDEDDKAELICLSDATLVNDKLMNRNFKSNIFKEEIGNIKTFFNPIANEIGTENKNAAIRGAKKHAPLIRALSFENNKELIENDVQEEYGLLKVKNELQNNKEITIQNLCIQEKQLDSSPLTGQRLTSNSFQDTSQIDENDKLEITQEIVTKIMATPNEAIQAFEPKITNHSKMLNTDDISSEDLLTSMLRLPIPSSRPKNEKIKIKKKNSQSVEKNSNDIFQDLKKPKPNSFNKNLNENKRFQKIKSKNDINFGEKVSVAITKNEIIQPQNGHKVLTRVVNRPNSIMEEHYIGLSEDTLYTLKQKRIKERNMKKNKSIKSNEVKLDSQSSLTPNYSNHYKQFAIGDSKRDPIIVKKTNKCNVM